MFTENLDVFFNQDEMAVAVAAGAQTASGILDTPGQIIAGGQIVNVQYALRYITARLTLSSGQSITVGGIAFKVREIYPEDDGAISLAHLTKV